MSGSLDARPETTRISRYGDIEEPSTRKCRCSSSSPHRDPAGGAGAGVRRSSFGRSGPGAGLPARFGQPCPDTRHTAAAAGFWGSSGRKLHLAPCRAVASMITRNGDDVDQAALEWPGRPRLADRPRARQRAGGGGSAHTGLNRSANAGRRPDPSRGGPPYRTYQVSCGPAALAVPQRWSVDIDPTRVGRTGARSSRLTSGAHASTSPRGRTRTAPARLSLSSASTSGARRTATPTGKRSPRRIFTATGKASPISGPSLSRLACSGI